MIPGSAMEAAHKAWREQSALEGSIFEYNLRAALEAAGPHIAAAEYTRGFDDGHLAGQESMEAE